MYYGGAIIIWALGLYFTSEAMAAMGANNPLATALIVQVILSFGQSLLLNDKYKSLPAIQQKIVLIFATLFIIFDVWLNFRGLEGYIGDVALIMPEEVVAQMGPELLNTLVRWVAAIGISVLAEILFNVGKSRRREMY